MFPSALVAVDFSPATRHLLKRLLRLKQLGTERVLLLHVAKPGEDEEEATERLALKAERLKGTFEVESIVVTGNPAETVLATAAERDIPLIVLASRDHPTSRRVLLGSTAAEIVRRADRSVLLENAHSEAGDELADHELNGSVLLATDGSDSVEPAERLALELGRERRLKVINVVDHDELEKGWRALERITNLAAGAYIPVHRNVSTGRPGEEIARIAQVERASLIIVGRRGRGGLRGRLGSTAETVCRAANTPVLLIPA